MSQHKTPCSECPFRKKSWRGYLGPHESAAEILSGVSAGLKFPCHSHANAIKKHLLKVHGDKQDALAFTDVTAYEQATREAPHCAGALAMLNNACAISRNSVIAKLQNVVGRRDDVFENEPAMKAYHDDPKFVAVRVKMRSLP